MKVDLLRSFYAYNTWANTRILDTAALITPEQFLQPGLSSFGSIRDTLVHTMEVQDNWLQRFKKLALHDAPAPEDFPDVESLRTRWLEIDQETDAFLEIVTEGMMDEVIHYVNRRGEPWSYKLWEMMLHQVNHATQHRSEVAAMLTDFGHSPGWLDYLIYIDQLET